MGCGGCGRKYNPAWKKLTNLPPSATPPVPGIPRVRAHRGIIRAPAVVPDEIKNYRPPEVKPPNENNQ